MMDNSPELHRTPSGLPDLDMYPFTIPDELYREYEESEVWFRICEFLDGKVWHVTTPAGWDGIQQDGLIRPNIELRFGDRRDWAGAEGAADRDLAGSIQRSWHENSYGYANGFVCLFDFRVHSLTERPMILLWNQEIREVIRSSDSELILLQLNDHIPTKPPLGFKESRLRYIPLCEVWSTTSIESKNVVRVFNIEQFDGRGKHELVWRQLKWS